METVGGIVTRARLILQETTADGIRWKAEEIGNWLNEAYAAFVSIKPEAHAQIAVVTCVPGTRQTIPENGVRLLAVLRNRAGEGYAITRAEKPALDASRPRWHSEDRTVDIEQYVFDESDPRTFYVYPPAAQGAKVEVLYSSVPDKHEAVTPQSDEAIRLTDTYAPALLDYVLYRCYQKDAESPASQQRMATHYEAWRSALGLKSQAAAAASPNNRRSTGGAP